jgi:hypothetical protein
MSSEPQKDKADLAAAGTEELKSSLEVQQAKLRAAKIAYHNRSELDGKIPEYEDLVAVARQVIALSYQLQNQLYGEVRIKMSEAKLLRATSR